MLPLSRRARLALGVPLFVVGHLLPALPTPAAFLDSPVVAYAGLVIAATAVEPTVSRRLGGESYADLGDVEQMLTITAVAAVVLLVYAVSLPFPWLL